nr:MAG TPA: hypothetical protein [Caudoviricetes sp.]
MSYICRKTLTISGVLYNPGDIIEEGVILPDRIRSLKTIGMISEMGDYSDIPATKPSVVSVSEYTNTIDISVKVEKGNIELPMTAEEIKKVFSVLQMNNTDSVNSIKEIESENVLILIHATDGRKSVQNAAKERAGIINSIEGDKTSGESNGEEIKDTKTSTK